MKATGIVRRIDDLGRVVIPKEIRRTMRIREGDPLEIYTDNNGEVIFKKYSPIGELHTFASSYAETLNKSCGLKVVICDRDSVIACAGVSKKNILSQKFRQRLTSLLRHALNTFAKRVTPKSSSRPALEKKYPFSPLSFSAVTL